MAQHNPFWKGLSCLQNGLYATLTVLIANDIISIWCTEFWSIILMNIFIDKTIILLIVWLVWTQMHCYFSWYNVVNDMS